MLRLGDMKKIITPLVDIVLCTYIITTCFICLSEFNNWQNKNNRNDDYNRQRLYHRHCIE